MGRIEIGFSETYVVATRVLLDMLWECLVHHSRRKHITFKNNELMNVDLITNRSSIRSGLLLGVLALILSGCSLVLPSRDTADPVITPQLPPTPHTAPAPVVDDTASDPAPAPIIEPPPVVPEPVVLPVAIVLSGRAPAYENVVTELAQLLENSQIYDLSDKSLTQKDVFDAIRDNESRAVVAVGLRAANFARGIEDIPVVFSQVFNVIPNRLNGENFKGVAAIPPLDMQMQAWLQMNPDLKSIGAIVGNGHDDLIAEAIRTTDANGMKLSHHLVTSDRETLYHFMRLAPKIDGFWLFPDNRILSAGVLREMLDYAPQHGVQVAVFNDALLPLGAAISTTSVNADIAQTIVSVLVSMVSGDQESVPDMTPLSRIGVRTGSAGATQVALGDSVLSEEAR
jgi:ABC-type uncharacterized transport system substrate-binding protein